METGTTGIEKKPRSSKESLDARFAALQEANRARRQSKVTGADIERRLEERKAERSQKPAQVVPGQRARTLSLGLGVVLLAASGVIAVATSAGTDSFNVAQHSNEQQIAVLQGELDRIPAADEQSAAEHSSALEEQIAQATAKGAQVAELQQGFATILAGGDTEGSGDGAPSTAEVDAAEHRKQLAPYFVDQSFPVEDVRAYAPGSTLPFGPEEIDPRFPWYVGYEADGQLKDPTASQWELVSVIATDTPGVLDATWLNQSTGADALFAWATASYYAEPEAFGNLVVGHTTLGERGATTTEKAGA